MTTKIFLEKRTYLLRLLHMFRESNELSVSDIRKKIPSTTYYSSLLAKLLDLNSKMSSDQWVIKATFVNRDGRLLTGIKKNPRLRFDVTDNFVVLSVDAKK
jgi:hypothetical protein